MKKLKFKQAGMNCKQRLSILWFCPDENYFKRCHNLKDLGVMILSYVICYMRVVKLKYIIM